MLALAGVTYISSPQSGRALSAHRGLYPPSDGRCQSDSPHYLPPPGQGVAVPAACHTPKSPHTSWSQAGPGCL